MLQHTAITMHRLGIVLAMAAFTAPIFCQTSTPPSTYERFFQELATLRSPPQPVLLNGQPQPGLRTLTPEEAIGITTDEVEILKAAAQEAMSQIQPLVEDLRALRFELLIQSLADNKPDALAERTARVEQQKARIIVEQMSRLKTALGESSFQLVDNFIRAHRGLSSFFPPVGAPNRGKR